MKLSHIVVLSSVEKNALSYTSFLFVCLKSEGIFIYQILI